MGTLVLSRYAGEVVVIDLPDGRQVRVKFARLKRNGAIQLAFDAPPDVHIWRQELYEYVPRMRIDNREEPTCAD